MSMFRKTVMTSAIIGAGLVSTAGAAFAGDAPSHEGHEQSSSHSKHHESNLCVNNAGGSVHNGGATAFGGVNGSQGALQGNILCDAVKNNGNGNLSGNKTVVGLGSGSGSELPGLPDLGGLLGGTSAPTEATAVPQSASAAPTTQAAPAQQAAPAAPAAPAQTSTVQPIQS